MRDIALTAVIFFSIPFILRRPWLGVLVGAWISIMNPHRFAFGFAYDFPFAQVVAGATVLGILLGNAKLVLPRGAIILAIVLLMIWLTITLPLAFEPDAAYFQWVRVMKMFVLVILAAMLIRTRQQIDWFVWVLVISVGWYGVKGGIFTILTGGEHRVYGPPGGGFISDNNAIAIAMIMIIPLAFYLSMTVTSKRIKWLIGSAALLNVIAVLGSQSRGALVAVCAMSLFLWLKSQRKIVFGAVFLGSLAAGVAFMPDSWDVRMNSIQTYEEDGSAMGRINSWKMAINVAADHPLAGGGFELYSPTTFALYAPSPEDIHSAHSIYFQMLGEHGYVGLVLMLALGALGWVTARRIIAQCRQGTELEWGGRLARAIQVSLIGFAAGGAFVNIAYWEVPYYELIMLAAVHALITGRAPDLGQAGRESARLGKIVAS